MLIVPLTVALMAGQLDPVDEASPAESEQDQVTRCPHGLRADASTEIRPRIVINYPPKAAKKGLEGNVGVRVRVGCDGDVKDCVVEATSGHGILDDGACEDMLMWARFWPAKDAEGRPVESDFSTVLRYKQLRVGWTWDDNRFVIPARRLG